MAGTITALRFQKRRADRVNIYLDERFALALPALAAANLKRGQYLSDADISRLKALDEEELAHERCLRFLAYRPRSIDEVRRYLRRHAVPEPTIDSVIQRLIDAHYLDDEAFARSWVAERERFKPKGILALRHELRQKGIAGATIDSVLQSLDAENSAYRAGAARARRLDVLDKHAFRQKLGSYLLRRGYEHEVVWPVVEQLWRELHGDSNHLAEHMA